MEKQLAVMLVLLRPLMRELLPAGQQLCDEVGPFTAKGELFTDTQLQHLFEHVGWKFLGIPKWGYNINRSVHTTNTCNVAFQLGQDANSPLMWSVHHQSRMSKSLMRGNYCQASHRVQNLDRNSTVARCGSLKRGAEMRVFLAKRLAEDSAPANVMVGPPPHSSQLPPVFAPVAAGPSTTTEELLRLLAERGVVVSPTPGDAAGGGAPSPSASPTLSDETAEPVVAASGRSAASPSASPTPSAETAKPVGVASGRDAASLSAAPTPSAETAEPVGGASGWGAASLSVSPTPTYETAGPVVAAGGATGSLSEGVVGNKRAVPEAEDPATSSRQLNKKVSPVRSVSVF
jgi:hypothetical protein